MSGNNVPYSVWVRSASRVWSARRRKGEAWSFGVTLVVPVQGAAHRLPRGALIVWSVAQEK